MADMLSEILARYANSICPQTASTESSPSDDWSDAEVLERRKTAPPLPDAVFTIGPGTNSETLSNVKDLCSDTVIKSVIFSRLYAEARAMDFVRSHTSIPVPILRRVITGTSRTRGYLVLEKIEGTRLDRIWPSFSPLQRFLVAWTLRDYIRELRRASATYPRRHIPGPMADTPQRCHGPAWLFGDRSTVPFNSATELLDHYNQTYPTNGRRFDDSQPLVLTHNDLNMRNIIVGRDGKLWLVDWGWSGFYPPWSEYIAMMSAAENDDAPKSRWAYIPLVTGAWVKELGMLGF